MCVTLDTVLYITQDGTQYSVYHMWVCGGIPVQRFREWCQRSSTGTLSVDRPVPSNDDDDNDRLAPFLDIQI